MRQREVERYRGMLTAQLQQLIGHGNQAVHHLAGEQARDELPDPSDRATAEEERAWSLRLADRDRKLIPKLQDALARLDAGTFGTCTRCGRPIASARLRARPMTELCIACKTEAEQQER
ncbi:MAG TPA: TraR/DksA C4-type zinc finger protein [Anaeromyxobacter sp.]|nr:TraR/DksA C4-type zinc finger protein [Anaeromyxobacter sp.]